MTSTRLEFPHVALIGLVVCTPRAYINVYMYVYTHISRHHAIVTVTIVLIFSHPPSKNCFGGVSTIMYIIERQIIKLSLGSSTGFVQKVRSQGFVNRVRSTGKTIVGHRWKPSLGPPSPTNSPTRGKGVTRPFVQPSFYFSIFKDKVLKFITKNLSAAFKNSM